MTILASKHYGQNHNTEYLVSNNAFPEELFEEQWMGVYFNEEKIGCSSRKMVRRENSFGMSELLKMKLKVMREEKDVEVTVHAVLDNNMRLMSFDTKIKADAEIYAKGKVEGRSLIVSINAGGKKSSQTIKLSKEPSLNILAVPGIIKEGLKTGKKFNMSVFEPSLLRFEDMDIEVSGKESVTSMGIKQDAYKLKGSISGAEFTIWLTERGEILREESPTGFVLIRESKEKAMNINTPSVDIISNISVPFNIKLSPDTSYLKIRLSNFDLNRFELDGGRQTLKGDVLEIRKEVIGKINGNSYPSPPFSRVSTRGFLDEYLKDTVFIQSNDPHIVSLSKEIVKNEKDTIKAARLIHDWVYKNIDKSPTITIPTASEVLKTRKGDCNEHATLFTALLRASGIPARIAVGLAHKEGYFYYHAWAEIFSGRWIAVDPTLGQFPADAAHIRLVTGDIDRQLLIASVIGKIRLEGLEYR